jgi:hypothetical protein
MLVECRTDPPGISAPPLFVEGFFAGCSTLAGAPGRLGSEIQAHGPDAVGVDHEAEPLQCQLG